MQHLLYNIAQYQITPQVAGPDTMISTGPAAVKLAVYTFFVMLMLVVIVVLVFNHFKKRNAAVSVSEDIKKTVDKQKGILLSIAMQKRQEREQIQKEEMIEDRLQAELDAITVDMTRHFGHLCPHTNVAMDEEMELVVWVDEDICYTRMGWDEQFKLIPYGQTVTVYYWPEQYAEKFST